MSTKIQCGGITKKGIQCKNKAKHGEQTCGIHCLQEFINCGICLDVINLNSQETHRLLECGHNFCKKCINTWIIEKYPNCSCPMCRAPITMNSTKFGSLAITFAFDWGFKSNYIYEYSVNYYNLDLLSDLELILFKEVEYKVFKITGIDIRNNTFRIFSMIAIQFDPNIEPIIDKLEDEALVTRHFKKTIEGVQRIKDYDTTN